MGGLPTPSSLYNIEMCDCMEGSHRGEVETFYERDGNSIVCSNCGTIPCELPGHVSDDHRIELNVYHEVDGLFMERYNITLPPQP